MKIIIQAGGRGSRLRNYTWNKPKCLVAVNNKPILYHLFDKFPKAEFIIIGDYKLDVLKKYLKALNPKVCYALIKTCGSGTISGLNDALKRVPENEKFLLIWSDLVFNDKLKVPKTNKPVIFTTQAIPCRWGVHEGGLRQTANAKDGIPGIFFFPNKKVLEKLPYSGEFVRWYSNNIKTFKTSRFDALSELGDLEVLSKQLNKETHCRFFNNVKIDKINNLVSKSALTKKHSSLNENEINWYKKISCYRYSALPKIKSYKPLKYEYIYGKHPFEYATASKSSKIQILTNILDSLKELHSKDTAESNVSDLQNVYVEKTLTRVYSIKNLVPHFKSKEFVINGKKCINPFVNIDKNFKNHLNNLQKTECFRPIHGDPTFSNCILNRNLKPKFIDPRGSFNKIGIFGDYLYDFAKVYYSSYGCYDMVNRKRFKLFFDKQVIEILVPESGFVSVSDSVFKRYLNKKEFQKVKVIHALIYLSLSGYVLEDYDSILAAFYLGVYHFNNAVPL